MRPFTAPRVFDVRAPEFNAYWIVLLPAGYFLVPVRRGGWSARQPIVPPQHLVELSTKQARAVWAVLIDAPRPKRRRWPLIFANRKAFWHPWWPW